VVVSELLSPPGDGKEPSAGADPLLPGENRRGVTLDDAEHWIAVYEELTGFLTAINGGAHVGALGRYRRRLDYWRGQWAALSTCPAPAEDTAEEQRRG
jgi:hypothetical protein